MRIRLGIVGLGETWDNRHRPALRALSDRFEVRAICCDVPHLAEQAARDFRAEQVDGFRALTARSDIDALLILSADWYGPLPILAACEHGKAVYCATGLDIADPQEAERLRAAVESAGVAFLVVFSRRLAPATVRLKVLIATRLGQPRLIFCHRRSSIPPASAGTRPARNRPTMLREMMEQVDWCRYVVGCDPTSVLGLTHRCSETSDGEDYQMLNLDFSDQGKLGFGSTAQISCGRYMPSAWPEAVAFRPPAALQVCCERGIAFVDLPSGLTWFDEAGRHTETLDDERPLGERLLMHFYRAVTSLVRRTNDLQDANIALHTVLAAHQSFAEGRRIELPFQCEAES
jgi:predicted dehydrogenase